jgi:hypothetical protein
MAFTLNNLHKMRTKVFSLCIATLLNLTSCFNHVDKNCARDYIGVFQVDTTFSPEPIKRLIFTKGWDTLHLFSYKNGRYHINTNDPLLKDAEGRWYTESKNIEGDCIGYIKQKNLSTAIPKAPFILTIKDTITFSIRFMKVDR